LVSYFGGPLLQSPVIVAVFWNSDVNSTLQANIGQFYADVTLSSYWPWLQEYDSVGLGGSNQVILSGSFGGNFVLAPQLCPASVNDAGTATCELSDANIQSELVRQIGLGVLPPVTLDCTGNSNTLYMVDLPPNVSLAGPPGAGLSCVENGFCGYHNTGTYGASNTPLVYGVLMDVFTGPCATGCSKNATALDNATDLHSHELVESVTDPDVGLDLQSEYAYPAAWGDNDNNCGEIADICDDGRAGDPITVDGRTWIVQELWSNRNGKCMSTGPSSEAICSGTPGASCRLCSCGDNGGACNGATPICETSSASAWFGACVGCTATGGNCSAGDICADDRCVVPGTDAGAGTGLDADTDSAAEGAQDGSLESSTDGASDSGGDGGQDGGDASSTARSPGGTGSDSGPPDADASSVGARIDADVSDGRGSDLNENDSGAQGDAHREADANAADVPGDNASGCGCHVAAGGSSASSELECLAAIAFLGCLRFRRRGTHTQPQPEHRGARHAGRGLRPFVAIVPCLARGRGGPARAARRPYAWLRRCARN
jgi:hypothetical protein